MKHRDGRERVARRRWKRRQENGVKQLGLRNTSDDVEIRERDECTFEKPGVDIRFCKRHAQKSPGHLICALPVGTKV
ncbi:hypothetical protein O3P69_018216 [Scylla paramamosain]|uniref:Uncharacterized protein n=1 Tax=Scylla paramamosain TaxID=85552 RepID=A0AAW0TJF6_SCYPA